MTCAVHRRASLGRRYRRALLAAGLTAATAFPVVGGDWPQWRGPQGTARTTDFQAPQVWPQTLQAKWKHPVGEGASTPALVGDRLYVFARQDGKEILRCLDADSGKTLWEDKYPALGASGAAAASFSGPRASPAVAGGKVVTVGVRGMLSCLDAATGKVLWRKDDFGGATPRFQAASSPLILNDLVIVQLGGTDNGAIAAYQISDGSQKWKSAGTPSYGSPAAMTVDGVALVLAMTEKEIVAVRADDGKQVWSIPFVPKGTGVYNASTPVVDGETFFYSGSGRGTHAVKVYRKGDSFAATELWSNDGKWVKYNSPVLKDGMLYGLSASNAMFCLDAASGKTKWSQEIPGGGKGSAAKARPGTREAKGKDQGAEERSSGSTSAMSRSGYGSVVDAGSVLMLLTPTSDLIVVKPDPEKYQEAARLKVAETPTYAYPVVSGQRLIIKDQESVALLEVK